MCCLRSSLTNVHVTHYVLIVLSFSLSRCDHVLIPPSALCCMSMGMSSALLSTRALLLFATFSLRVFSLALTQRLSLSPCASIPALSVKIRSIIARVRSRHSLYCGSSKLSHATPALHSQETCSVTASLTVQQTPHRISAQLLEFFQLQRQWEFCSLFVGYDFLRQFQRKSHHLQRSATKTVPVRCIPCVTQWLSRPAFALYNSTLFDTQNGSRSIMITNKDSSRHTACK